MSNRSKRSRKRRSAPSARRGDVAAAGQAVKAPVEARGRDEDESGEDECGEDVVERERASRGRAGRASPPTPVSRSYGERPRPPWHPLPLSELLILVGAIGVLVGFGRGLSHGGPPLLAGIAAVALGTLEVTIREHRGGYRSHTVMLAALPVVVFHSVVELAIAVFTPVPAIVTVGLLGLDLLLFLALFKLLRTNFLTARTKTAGRG